jgi:hypothetical protein
MSDLPEISEDDADDQRRLNPFPQHDEKWHKHKYRSTATVQPRDACTMPPHEQAKLLKSLCILIRLNPNSSSIVNGGKELSDFV